MEPLNRARIMNVERSILTLVALFVICSATTAESMDSYSHEQRHFSAEGTGARKPVQIPDSVLAILRTDEDVRNVLENESIPPEQLPSKWFSASAIHLSSPERVDLVVMGEGPLRGANVITFWIFCATPHGYDLVLTAPAHDLIVKNTRWKGHSDVELVSMTAVEISTVICRFDGKRYTKYRAKLERIP